MDKRQHKTRGPIYWSLYQLRKFKSWSKTDVRVVLWGMSIIAVLGTIGIVLSVLGLT
jgi:hypothetical protein